MSLVRVVPETIYEGDVAEFQIDATVTGLPSDAVVTAASASGPFGGVNAVSLGPSLACRQPRLNITRASTTPIQVRVTYRARVNGVLQDRSISSAPARVDLRTFPFILDPPPQPLNSWRSTLFPGFGFRFDLADSVTVGISKPLQPQTLTVYSGSPLDLLEVGRRGDAPPDFFRVRREPEGLLFAVSTLVPPAGESSEAASNAYQGSYAIRVEARQTRGLPAGIASRSALFEGRYDVGPPLPGDLLEVNTIEYVIEDGAGSPVRDGRWRIAAGQPVTLNAPPGARLRLIYNGQFVLRRTARAKLVTNLRFPDHNRTDLIAPELRNTNGDRSPIENQMFGGNFRRTNVILDLPSTAADFEIEAGLLPVWLYEPSPGRLPTQADVERFLGATFANIYPVKVRWGPPADITVDHIEVVQAVQSAANTVPLIAGKRTVARVFAVAKGPIAGLTPNQPGVVCTLRAFRGGNPLPGAAVPISPLPATIPGDVFDRGRSEDAIAFELPPEWTTEGAIELRAELSLSGNLRDAREDNNDFILPSVTFVAPPLVNPIPVRWFRACHQPDPARDACPDAARWSASVENLAGLMNRLYPVAEGGIRYRRLSSKIKVWKGSFDHTGMEFFNYMRLLRSHVGSLFPNEELGLFTAVFPVGTRVAFGPQSSRLIAGLAPINDSVSWIIDQDNSAGTEFVLAHESGHSLGLEHPMTPDNGGANGPAGYWRQGPNPQSAAIQEAGFDISTGAAIPPTHFDFMSYAWPIWISPFHFDRLQRNVYSNDVSSVPAPKPPRTADALSDIMVLSGVISRDGSSASFDPAFRAPSPGVVRSRWNAAGQYCFRFFNGTQPLASNCFDVSTTNSDGVEFDRYPFAFNLALPAGATRVGLYRGTAELAVLESQGPPPSVSIASPGAGARWQGPQRIAWTSTGTGRLTHAVYFSSDGGATWEPLDVDLRQPVLDVHSADLPAGANVVIRVASSSGFLSSAATAGPITVLPTPRGLLSAASLDFGAVDDGKTADRSVDLVSTGNTPLTVRAARVEGRAFQLVAAPGAPLAEGAAGRFQVRFDPPSGGLHVGTLIIETDHFDAPVFRIPLSGLSRAPSFPPSLAVSPERVDFGPVSVGQSRELTMTVRNSGPFPVTVTSLTASRPQYSSAGLTLPLLLNPGASRAITVRFAPDAAGAFPGSLLIGSDGQGLSVPLGGTGAAPGPAPGPAGAPRAEVAPASLSFGSVNVGQNSELSLTLRNAGTETLTVTGFTLSHPAFSVPAPVPPASIPAGSQAAVRVRFSPASAGPVASTLRIATNDPSQPVIQVALDGAGANPPAPAGGQLEVQTSVDFGQAAVGETRTAALPLRNPGAAPVAVTQIIVSGAQFSVAPVSLPLTIAAGSSAVITLRMTPAAPGPQSGSLTLRTTSAEVIVALSGSAAAPAAAPVIAVSPPAVQFGAVAPGQSATQPLQVRNTGTAPLVITSLSISSDRFLVVGITAPVIVAPQSAVAWTLRFSPNAPGSFTATLVIGSNDGATPSLTVPLSGVASENPAAPRLAVSQSLLNFEEVRVGATAELTIELRNTGAAPLQVSSIRIDNPRFSTPGSTSFSLPPGNVFDLRVLFTPSSAGEQKGRLTITSNDPLSPHGIDLIGAGR